MLHTRADAVFILGDLFEVWIGDDMAERGFEARCVDVLSAAAARTTVAFMPGNRDFLVGDAMLAGAGVSRLADPTVVVAFGARVVVSHGDALCIDDVAYQRYRSVVRRPGLQRAFGGASVRHAQRHRTSPAATQRAARAARQRQRSSTSIHRMTVALLRARRCADAGPWPHPRTAQPRPRHPAWFATC